MLIKRLNSTNISSGLIRQRYAILDSQNLHIKISRCNTELFAKKSTYFQAISGIILISSLLYELSQVLLKQGI